MKIQHQSDCKGYSGSGFINTLQKRIREVVIPYQYEVLNDRIEGIERSHAILNFINAGKQLNGDINHDGFYGMVFQDSDVAKWLEAASYSLIVHPDSDLEARIDEVIDIVVGAQDEDGYLNTYYTVKDKDKRWSNLLEGHELYCSGHMIEASVAYFEATGKDKLLNAMKKNADHIYDYFITQKHPGYPGHPEIELALLKLYRATKEHKYLELSKHFIDIRGVDPLYFENEANDRSWSVWGSDGKDVVYNQAIKPVRQQKDAMGHSVRAVYLYTAMADLASETEDAELIEACKRLWNSIVQKRMYVTGAIGSTVLGEAFTVDYNLPNDTTYGETCASIGLMYFASRMLENEVKGEYSDVMELAFYNTVLAGMQLDGKRFFYVNPLEVIPGVSGLASTHKHTLSQRPAWYACACCPPNVARTISSIAKYAYGESNNVFYCHMFVDGTKTFSNGMTISCKTDYPYDLNIEYKVIQGNGNLAVHIPGWSLENYSVTQNGQTLILDMVDGYVYLEVREGDTISISLDSSIKRIYCSGNVASNTGMVAIKRGPLIYCAEGVDNNGDVLSLFIKEDGDAKVSSNKDELLDGSVSLEIDGYRIISSGDLYSDKKPYKKPCKIKMVPYYVWGNRGENQMRVWMPER
ncbi:MAG: glycoside hydrolase family 127 protein [Clostridia bacterium]|nr:glycoside hydrolase family 127 protein [Clostridia bacterium]